MGPSPDERARLPVNATITVNNPVGLLSPHKQEDQLWLVCERRGDAHHEYDSERRFQSRDDAQTHADSLNAAVRVPGYFYVMPAYGDE